MYKNNTIAVVVPAYNEEKLIGRVLESMPDFVDKIVVIDDVNRIYKTNFVHKDAFNNSKSRWICINYLKYWGKQYERKTGKKPTYEIYSRMWNGGPNGWKKKSTNAYWKKVKRVLAKMK